MELKDRLAITQFMEERKIIAIIRTQESGPLLDAVSALKNGGVECIEITMTTPGALRVLEEVRSKRNDILFGAGTVLDKETARACILSGAQFIVTPSLDPEVIELAHRYDVPVIPGALTPTEILSAWQKGAEVVKIFPVSSLGPDYIKNLRGPFPQIKFCPTGGINLNNISDYLRAGASCVGVGGSLVKKEFIKNNAWAELQKLAEQFVAATKVTK